MFILMTVPLTCWLCVLVASPRRPRLGNEVEELVYTRLLGRQQLLTLLAIVMTAMAGLIIVLTLPSQIAPARPVFQVGQQVCTHTPSRPAVCYNLQADGRWQQEPSESPGGIQTGGDAGSLNPNASTDAAFAPSTMMLSCTTDPVSDTYGQLIEDYVTGQPSRIGTATTQTRETSCMMVPPSFTSST
jgi:hypothetical protein